MEYRKELKFLCTEWEFAQIRQRIGTLMKQDANQTSDSYNIRSIYFDDYDDTCFRENEAGVDQREKYRIRIYDKSDRVIKAEIKSKYRDATKKTSCKLSRRQMEELVFDHRVSEPYGGNATLNLFKTAVESGGFHPVSIVEYERTAFVYPIGNVRVTFDRNISGSDRFQNFFESSLFGCPVLAPGKHVLEVKYDEFLPDYIAQLLELGSLSRTSYSKYYYSRMVTGGSNYDIFRCN